MIGIRDWAEKEEEERGPAYDSYSTLGDCCPPLPPPPDKNGRNDKGRLRPE